jgi:hypothetical protein
LPARGGKGGIGRATHSLERQEAEQHKMNERDDELFRERPRLLVRHPAHERGDLLLHPRHVGCRIDLRAVGESDPILRIEPHHFHLGTQGRAGGGEDFLQHARIEEEGGAGIESETVLFDRRCAPADRRHSLQPFHFQPGGGQQQSRSEAHRVRHQ